MVLITISTKSFITSLWVVKLISLTILVLLTRSEDVEKMKTVICLLVPVIDLFIVKGFGEIAFSLGFVLAKFFHYDRN